MPLVAHLRDDTVLLLGGHEKLALLERVRKRLLAEDGESALHRGHKRGEMRVVGSHHGNGVDLAVHRVEHLAEIREVRRVGVALQRCRALPAVEIRVAERDDLRETGLLELLDVVPRLLANAHARQANLVALRESCDAREGRDGTRRQRCLQK